MVMHWARVIELVYASELAARAGPGPARSPARTSRRRSESPDEGVGILEAPRGTLVHHYVSDKNGITTDVNLVVGTTNNNAPINLSVRKAAKALDQELAGVPRYAEQVEMAYRAYDPCNSCATHTLPGQMPLRVNIRKSDGSVFQEIKNY